VHLTIVSCLRIQIQMCTHCIRNMKYTCTNHIFFENSNKTNKYFVIKIIIYDLSKNFPVRRKCMNSANIQVVFRCFDDALSNILSLNKFIITETTGSDACKPVLYLRHITGI
jgi:hypothetical protein